MNMSNNNRLTGNSSDFNSIEIQWKMREINQSNKLSNEQSETVICSSGPEAEESLPTAFKDGCLKTFKETAVSFIIERTCLLLREFILYTDHLRVYDLTNPIHASSISSNLTITPFPQINEDVIEEVMHNAIIDKYHDNSYCGTDIRWKIYNETWQLKINLKQKYKELLSSNDIVQAMLKFHDVN